MVELDKRRRCRGDERRAARRDLAGRLRRAAADRVRARALEVPEPGLTALDAFRTLAGRVDGRAGGARLALPGHRRARAGPRRRRGVLRRARRAPSATPRTSCPPSGCATGQRSRATPASPRAARARRCWQRSPAPGCTTSRPSSCAGTAAPTSASAASSAPTAVRSRGRSRARRSCAASARPTCGCATATSRPRRSCAACTTHGGRELEHSYGEHGVELRFRVPLARCDSLASAACATRRAAPWRWSASARRVIRSC